MSPPPQWWPTPWRSPFLIWQRGGWVGVDLFFVLSGFLVSGLLFAEYKSRGSLSIARFYVRRGWKIYPPFYALIATTIAVSVVLGAKVPPMPLVSELVFLQSYFPGLWNHTWSLAVEEHFYFLLPLLLTLMLRWNRGSPNPLKPVLALAAGVAISAFLMRLLNWHYRTPYSHLTHLYPSHLRLDSLFFGVAISYVYHFHTDRFKATFTPSQRWLIPGGTILLAPAFAFQLETTPFIFTVGLTLFYFGSGMLLVGVLLRDLPHNCFTAWLASLGAHSYSIYLWHMAMRNWGISGIERILGSPLSFNGRTTVYLVGSLVIGVVMAKLVEVPSLRLRDNWFPAKVRGEVEAQTKSAM